MKIITSIILFSLSFHSFAQLETPKEEVEKILRKNDIFSLPYRETAKKAFEDYLLKYPTNPYNIIAYYWLAEIANRTNDIAIAKRQYLQVLKTPIPDSVDRYNYRYNATMRLAEIFINDAHFANALHYLDNERKKFTPRYDCGNARMDDDISIKLLYARCYIGQGKYTQVVEILLPYIFTSWNGDGNKILMNKLYEAYLKIHTKNEIKNAFLNAEKTLLIKSEKYYSHSYLQPYIKVFDKEIKIQDYSYDLNKLNEQEQKQKCIETIQQSVIYKLATQ